MTLCHLPRTRYSTTADYEDKVYPEPVQLQYSKYSNALEISPWLLWQMFFFYVAWPLSL